MTAGEPFPAVEEWTHAKENHCQGPIHRDHKPSDQWSLTNNRTTTKPCKGPTLRQSVNHEHPHATGWDHSLQQTRIGEADHPGPPEPNTFVLGCANANNLLTKADTVRQMPKGIWGFSETCLTKGGNEHFLKTLNAGHHPKLRFLPGAPAPYTSTNIGAIGGKHVGVAFCSSMPCRPLTNDWRQDQWLTGRIQVAGFFAGQWIKGGVAYGYAKDSHTPKVIEQTEDLLKAITTRIVLQSHGPRFLMGDFNLETPQIDLAKLWQNHGFVEAQTFAHYAWGQEPRKTCKQKTIKDHVWLSRELLPFVTGVKVDTTWFSDHALVYVELKPLGAMEPVPIWRKPQALPWDQLPEDTDFPTASNLDASDPERFYPLFWHAVESQVDSKLRVGQTSGLQPMQCGRAQTTEVNWTNQEPPPLRRAGCHGVQGKFIGDHWQHYNWTRQLRRLQSYCNMTKSTNQKIVPDREVQALWHSIIKAPGFPQGFRRFWPHRACQTAGSPKSIPRWPPNHDLAFQIFQSFQAEHQLFEAKLIKQRRMEAKLARIADPHKIYKDTATPQAMPVHTLLTTFSTTVESVDPDGCVTYKTGDLDPSLPLIGPQGPLYVVQHIPGEIRLEPDTVEEGNALTQQRYVASRQEMFQQFQDLWLDKWDKHRHTDTTRWTAFASFIDRALPHPPEEMPYLPITLEQWRKALQHKKSRTATGPDGISKEDLLRLPTALTENLLQMFWHIEQGQPWPQAMRTGLITAIEKRIHADRPSEFRPICVLSLPYRIWSSIRTKQILAWLAKFSPDGLLGNRSKRETAHVWWKISALVERSWYDGEPLAGGISDIVKCYNCLPRIPVFHMARQLRIPEQILKPWFSAITGLERRFTINGGTGPALRATTGFPEGDPLSVASMYIVNIGLFAWLHHATPTVQLWSFVDNMEITSQTSEGIIDGFQGIKTFCQELDIELDSSKTVTWATSTQQRDILRQAGHAVIYDTKDLGGQMTFCRRHTNKVLRARADKLTDYWPRLARSPAPLRQKQISLRVAAWPKALYGISTTIFGQDHINRLRTRALRGLGWSNKGMHPMLQLSCICDIRSDPGYWCLWQTVLSFRRFADPLPSYEVLDFLTDQPDRRVDPGPCGVLLQRLHMIAWSWQGNGWFLDHKGLAIHVFDSPISLLKRRLQLAWWTLACSKAAERNSMEGIENADVALTLASMKKIELSDQGFVRYALNGSFFTNDKLIHSGLVDQTSCPWCPADDSVLHRHWFCPATADLRAKIDPQILDQIHQAPLCTRNHGWISEPEALQDFHACLHNLPDRTKCFQTHHCHFPVAHLFTDGSAVSPADPILRVATWGVSLATLPAKGFLTLAQGFVPGLMQTVLRAEILACISALEWIVLHDKPAILWVDNLEVQRTLEAFRTGDTACSNTSNDHDLWQRLFDLTQQAVAHQLLIKVAKIHSHSTVEASSSPVEKWAILGNESADRAAEEARSLFTPHFWKIRDSLKRQIISRELMRDAVHWIFVAVGQRAQMAKTSTLDSAVPVPSFLPPPEDDHPCLFDPFPTWTDRDPAVQLGDSGQMVFDWLQHLHNLPGATPQWLSSYQLVIHFQQHSGSVGPVCINKQWFTAEQGMPLHHQYCFTQQCTWMSHFVVRLAKAFNIEVGPIRRRPAGSSFPIWTRCFKIKLPKEIISGIDHVFQKHIGKPIRKVGKDLQGMPAPTQGR